jgi:hypothetical protein
MQSHSDIYRYIQKSGIYSSLYQRPSINIQCKDPDVKPVTNDLVLSTTIVTVQLTIEQDVRPVLEKEKGSKVENHEITCPNLRRGNVQDSGHAHRHGRSL